MNTGQKDIRPSIDITNYSMSQKLGQRQQVNLSRPFHRFSARDHPASKRDLSATIRRRMSLIASSSWYLAIKLPQRCDVFLVRVQRQAGR